MKNRSFLSIDEAGIVIRLDSCSKFIAPGLRIGWITAAPEFINKYLFLQEVSCQFPSGLSQSIFVGLLKSWGSEGLDSHLQKTQKHYRDQCSATITALKDNFSGDICQYVIPTGGMFVWLTFNLPRFTSFDLFKAFASAGVITVPGEDFFVKGIIPFKFANTLPSIRITFAASTPQQIAQAIAKMADCIKALQRT